MNDDEIKTVADLFTSEAKVATPPASTIESVPSENSSSQTAKGDGVGKLASMPSIAVIAIACKSNGQDPCLVIEFDHMSGPRVRRLLPLSGFTSSRRARNALIKVGVPRAVASDDELLAALVDTSPSITGLYDVPHGWSRGCDVGVIHRYRDVVYSSSGPITVYADGPIPELQPSGDIGKLMTTLGADRSLGTVILTASHVASLLVHLLGGNPIVIIASGLPPTEVERLATLAESTFGTGLTALYTRSKDTDDALIDFVEAKSRKDAFAYAQALHEVRAVGSRRSNKVDRKDAPVTLIVTTEADSPGIRASPTLPPGCVEIHLGAAGLNVPNEAMQASSDMASHFHACATGEYIDAVLRKQDQVIRDAETMLLEFIERDRRIANVSVRTDVAPTADSFALLRYALISGQKFGVVPWNDHVAHSVMDACVASWADHHRQREAAFERHVISAVKTLAEPDSPGRLSKFKGREVHIKTINGRELLLIGPGLFESSVVGYRDRRCVLDTLLVCKLLVTNGDGNQYLARIDGNRTRFYAIDTAALKHFQHTGKRF